MEAEYDSTQSSYLEEQCILVDMEDEVVGHADKRTCHLSENVAKGLLHRAFSVFLFNSEGKLLLQQRAAEKITFPSCWTNTCCSHPLHTKEEMQTEDHIGVKRAAVRKLQHELGIKQHTIDTQDLHFVTRIYYKALQNDEVWAEHESKLSRFGIRSWNTN